MERAARSMTIILRDIFSASLYGISASFPPIHMPIGPLGK